jgi:hypothetical protein
MVSLFDSLMKSGNRMKFIQHFVQQKYFREFFFEIGHDPKFRIKNYDIAYKQYLKGVDRSKGVAHLQDYVFGNSVLFRHYFLSKQHKKAISHGKRLYQRVRSLEPWQKELHSFPFIRFTVYRLWYMQLTNAAQNLQRDYTKYLIDFCAKHKSMMQPYEQRMLFHTIAEVFANGNTPEIYHEKLKKIYKKEFDRIPDFVFDKHLKYSLPYFEPNGMLHLRP